MRSLGIGTFTGGMLWTLLACLLQLRELNSPETIRVAAVGAVLGGVGGTVAIIARGSGTRLRGAVQCLVGFVVSLAVGGAIGGVTMIENPAVLASWFPESAAREKPAPRPRVRHRPTRRVSRNGPELKLDRQTRRIVARLGEPHVTTPSVRATRLLFGIGIERGMQPQGRVVVYQRDDPSRVVWTGGVDPSESRRWQDVTVDLPADVAKVGIEIHIEPETEGAGANVVVSEPAFVRSPDGLHPRNLILISIDTLRADMLGAYGYTELPTSPYLDALAARGTLFENSFSPSPWTTPSHLAMLTGVQPDALGLSRLTGTRPRLPRERATLAELFRDAGFLAVAFTGMGTMGAEHGTSDGFYLQQESYNRMSAWQRDLSTNSSLARRWLAAHRHEPLFLFFHTFEVHDPYAHQRFLSANTRNVARVSYASGIAHTDDYLGHFIDALDDMGLLEDSILVVTSDHGEGFGRWPRNYHGKTLYDEVLRVPLIMVGDGIPAGRRVASQVPAIDLFATLADLYDLPVPDDVDSHSLREMIEGTVDEPRPVHLCCLSSHRTKDGTLQPQRLGIRTNGYKYVITESGDEEELYDLTADPDEKVNLVDTYGGIAAQLRLEVQEAARRNRRRAGIDPDGSRPGRIDPEYAKKLRALGYMKGPTEPAHERHRP